jgi:hypothetical protein
VVQIALNGEREAALTFGQFPRHIDVVVGMKVEEEDVWRWKDARNRASGFPLCGR